MTLHVAFFDNHKLVHASDRLLTNAETKEVLDREYNKVLFCLNESWSMIISVAGYVGVIGGAFDLVQSLKKSIIKHFNLSLTTLEQWQLSVAAVTEEVKQEIASDPTANSIVKFFDVMGSGFLGTTPIGFQIRYKDGAMQYEFRHRIEGILWIGATEYLYKLRELPELRGKNLHEFSILAKTIKVFSDAAVHSPTIGKDIMSLVLLPKRKELIVGYHPETFSPEIRLPIIIRNGQESPMSSSCIRTIGSQPNPQVTMPCPCQSRRMYQECHGSADQHGIEKAIYSWV